MKRIVCPECDHPLKLSAHPHRGQRIICPGCETKLVVLTLQPLELDAVQPASDIQPKTTTALETACPECEQHIRLRPNIHRGQMLTCRYCNTNLEVVNLKPLELDIALPLPQLRRQKKNRQHRLEANAKIKPPQHHQRRRDND